MAVRYTFKNLDELADHFRRESVDRHQGAKDVRSKRRAETLAIEAEMLAHVADVIASTTMEE